ncbi:hypothetical protein, partial [Prevotella sp.]|uniref:hypothetical protein n=1 Tax=Prevotella sp. TaxID=59823 RepID=UPI0027E276D1
MSLTPEQLAKIQQKESTLPDALRRDALTNYREGYFWLSGKVLGMFFLFHSILYLCIMNMLEQLARIVL